MTSSLRRMSIAFGVKVFRQRDTTKVHKISHTRWGASLLSEVVEDKEPTLDQIRKTFHPLACKVFPTAVVRFVFLVQS